MSPDDSVEDGLDRSGSCCYRLPDGSSPRPEIDKTYYSTYNCMSARHNIVKTVIWMGSSRWDLQAFPKEVRTGIGHALYAAQRGETDSAAKPLKALAALA